MTGDQDIVFLTVDSLRADHCGFLGSHSDLTPTLDNLASSGIIFEQAIAPGPRTPSSMPVVFTGEHLPPEDVDLHDWKERRGQINHHLRRYGTIATEMDSMGYDTIGITANPWTQGTEFSRGFQEYIEVDGNSAFQNTGRSATIKFADRALGIFDTMVDISWQNKRDWFIRWKDFFNKISGSISDGESPLFVWIFLLDAHEPYLSARKYRKETTPVEMYRSAWRQHKLDPVDGSVSEETQSALHKAYRDTIRSVDGFVERLLSEADLQNPVLVFHSDHGEAFGEHGTFGHQRELYEENIHVPLCIYNSDYSGRVSDPVSLRMLPELLEVLSGSESINTLEKYIPQYVYSSTELGNKVALRGERWKYMRNNVDDCIELYDLDNDPGENNNLIGNQSAVVDLMKNILGQKKIAIREKRQIKSAAKEISENI